jgi:prophage antirepressor-like protein
MCVGPDRGRGNPWWVAKEVCDILGYLNSRKAVKDHCKHAKLLRGNESLRLGFNPRGVTLIPESDLYRLTIQSKLPTAERFEEWVVEDVLPTIRKTGGYIQGDFQLGLLVARSGFE